MPVTLNWILAALARLYFNARSTRSPDSEVTVESRLVVECGFTSVFDGQRCGQRFLGERDRKRSREERNVPELLRRIASFQFHRDVRVGRRSDLPINVPREPVLLNAVVAVIAGAELRPAER